MEYEMLMDPEPLKNSVVRTLIRIAAEQAMRDNNTLRITGSNELLGKKFKYSFEMEVEFDPDEIIKISWHSDKWDKDMIVEHPWSKIERVKVGVVDIACPMCSKLHLLQEWDTGEFTCECGTKGEVVK